jgi:adenosyl cobinamide kinase/adenosyl cobinamide phosphate guanylyltransferase
MTLTLLIGGARAGKSALALRRAAATGRPVVFIATARASDAEMAERIDRHRQERDPGWATVEEPGDLAGALAAVPADACVIVDCLTLWVANQLGRDDEEIVRRGSEAAELAAGRAGPTIAVSNEVGMGVVPASALGRRYRDLLGRVNAVWAARADDAALVVAGRPLWLDD